MSKLVYQRLRGPAAVTVLVGLVACGFAGTSDCAAHITPGLEVVAVDSLTDVAPTSTGGVAVARAGAYADSTLARGDSAALRFRLAWRPGTYTVTVRVPGYRRWSRSDVRVESDGADVCPQLRTERLSVRLQPS